MSGVVELILLSNCLLFSDVSFAVLERLPLTELSFVFEILYNVTCDETKHHEFAFDLL